MLHRCMSRNEWSRRERRWGLGMTLLGARMGETLRAVATEPLSIFCPSPWSRSGKVPKTYGSRPGTPKDRSCDRYLSNLQGMDGNILRRTRLIRRDDRPADPG